MPIKPYNGHRSHAAYQISLWLNNDPELYALARIAIVKAKDHRDSLKSEFLKRRKLSHFAAPILLNLLPPRTPDGARYSIAALKPALDSIIDSLNVSKEA